MYAIKLMGGIQGEMSQGEGGIDRQKGRNTGWKRREEVCPMMQPKCCKELGPSLWAFFTAPPSWAGGAGRGTSTDPLHGQPLPFLQLSLPALPKLS